SLNCKQPLDHPPRNFAFTYDGDVGAKASQMFNLGVGMSARDNLNAWIGNSCLMHYLPRLKGILNRNNDVVSRAWIGRSQDIRAGRISRYRLNVLVPQVGERSETSASRLAPKTPASAGSKTKTSTIARSSTINQPTAMRPRSVS